VSDITDFLLTTAACCMGAASAYGFARSKYQALVTEEVKLRGGEIEKARAEERAKLDEAGQAAQRSLEEVRKEAVELRRQAEDARRDVENVRKEATIEAREAIHTAREEARRVVLEAEWSIQQREERAARAEQSTVDKDALVASREAELRAREESFRAREAAHEALRGEAAKLVDEQRARLEAIAGLSGETARKQILERALDETRKDLARETREIEESARAEAEKRAKRIIGIAIQRYAGEHVQDRAVTTVHLASDDMKGRIIGREGRNIRALQEACGVDFIVDDTPETIVISGFDPLRREVARISVERLIQDGRIHPSRIEEVVGQAQSEVERGVADAAEQALLELGVTRVHPEISRLVGKLRYRYSYAQNVLKHSIETGYLAGLMASELGLNEKQARRAGLLHDIGKAVSHEQEGGHAVIGGQIARKYGEDPIVVNGIACHHDDEPTTSVIGHLVTAADALSGGRPGARREMLEGYVSRLQDLERISTKFAGVERAFAIQAGREVRVMVEPGEVSDAEAALLAREISRRIEEELSYPGQIRVTVVRETRAVDYAK